MSVFTERSPETHIQVSVKKNHSATLAPNVFEDRKSEHHFFIFVNWLNQSRDFIVTVFTNIYTCTDLLFTCISGTQHLYILAQGISADAFIWNIDDRRYSDEGQGFVTEKRSPTVNLSGLTLSFRLLCTVLFCLSVSVNCKFGFGWTGLYSDMVDTDINPNQIKKTYFNQ